MTKVRRKNNRHSYNSQSHSDKPKSIDILPYHSRYKSKESYQGKSSNPDSYFLISLKIGLLSFHAKKHAKSNSQQNFYKKIYAKHAIHNG